MGRKAAIRIRCYKCGKYGTPRLDNGVYLKVRHYQRYKSGMISHYIGRVWSQRLKRALNAIDTSERERVEKIINELQENYLSKNAQNENEYQRTSHRLTEILNELVDLTELVASEKYSYTRNAECPHCNKKVTIQSHRKDQFTLTK